LKSTRGVHGGYGLARPPETITITEIITAMDGPIAIVECADNSSCALEGVCSMHGRWGKVNQAIRSALSNVTLSDLSTPAPIQNAMREGGV
jgi:Rrf2 family protein